MYKNCSQVAKKYNQKQKMIQRTTNTHLAKKAQAKEPENHRTTLVNQTKEKQKTRKTKQRQNLSKRDCVKNHPKA